MISIADLTRYERRCEMCGIRKLSKTRVNYCGMECWFAYRRRERGRRGKRLASDVRGQIWRTN